MFVVESQDCNERFTVSAATLSHLGLGDEVLGPLHRRCSPWVFETPTVRSYSLQPLDGNTVQFRVHIHSVYDRCLTRLATGEALLDKCTIGGQFYIRGSYRPLID
jgi:hypothetical protein